VNIGIAAASPKNQTTNANTKTIKYFITHFINVQKSYCESFPLICQWVTPENLDSAGPDDFLDVKE